MKINYDEILSAGIDYMMQAYDFYRCHPGPNYISHSNPKLYDDYHRMERAEHALDMVAYATGLHTADIIQAARIYNRYYDRGGEKIIDAQRLLEGLQ